MSNIYGGRTWESTPFYFDKIYNSKKEMINAIEGKDDGVFALRYVFVKYCETAFTHDERIAIEKQLDTRPKTSDALLYYNKFQEDGNISHDRKVYRKIYINDIPKYEEIAILNTTLSAEGLEEIQNELLGLNIKNDETGSYGIIQIQGYDPNQAIGYASAAFGGFGNIARGDFSFAAGIQSFATGKSSFALGYCNEASGVASVAMGQSALATSHASVAMGQQVKASGHAATALGYNTIANYSFETAVGAFNNTEDAPNALFAVGNGTKSTVNGKDIIHRSNAFVVYQDGHATVQSNSDDDIAVIRRIDMNQAIDAALRDLVRVYEGTTIPPTATAQIVILTG